MPQKRRGTCRKRCEYVRQFCMINTSQNGNTIMRDVRGFALVQEPITPLQLAGVTLRSVARLLGSVAGRSVLVRCIPRRATRM